MSSTKAVSDHHLKCPGAGDLAGFLADYAPCDCAYIIRDAETADNIYDSGSAPYVIKDGKIVFQSFAGKIVHK